MSRAAAQRHHSLRSSRSRLACISCIVVAENVSFVSFIQNFHSQAKTFRVLIHHYECSVLLHQQLSEQRSTLVTPRSSKTCLRYLPQSACGRIKETLRIRTMYRAKGSTLLRRSISPESR